MNNSNQPAFPIVAFDAKGDISTPETWNGLTKLEYFAGLAMQGILTTGKVNLYDQKELISHAIAWADELLKQLKK